MTFLLHENEQKCVQLLSLVAFDFECCWFVLRMVIPV